MRLILKMKWDTSIDFMLVYLQWLSVKARIVFNTGVANSNWSLGRNLENLPKILTFWATNNKKLKKYTKNIGKLLIFDSSLGQRNFFLGHMRPVGRGLATPDLIQ